MDNKEKYYLILPGCDDTNRGDQALIWETVELAQKAGFRGQYFMVADSDKSKQSKAEEIYNIDYLLPHPSSYFKSSNNIQYGKWLKMKWAAVSLVDCSRALILLTGFGRFLAFRIGRKKVKRSLEIYRKADAAFVKGGGFLHSYGGITSTYSLFYDLYHIILAQSMKIPVYVMPNSYGPFKGPGSRKLIAKVLKRCKLVTARESVSKAMLLYETGVSSYLYPDLAFYLDAQCDFTEKQLENLKTIPFGSKKCVALTMRPYRFPGFENPAEAYNKYKKVLCDFVHHLCDKGFYPVIIEHTYSHSEHERDMSCINDVVNLLGDSCEYSVYSDLSLNCRQLKYVYSQFEYIVGTRFHSVIFSISSLVPSLAITYGGNKGEGIMRDVGIEKYAIPIEKMNLNELILKFSDLEKNRDDVKARIKEYLDCLPEERVKIVEMMKE